MNNPKSVIQVNIDPANPGQFFACCGLFELADRLWGGVEGWFVDQTFMIRGGGTLSELIAKLQDSQINSSLTAHELKRLGTLMSAQKSTLTLADKEEKLRLIALWKRERLHLSEPFDLWLDWWSDEKTGGKAMKTWAAKQLVIEIARSMLGVIKRQKWSESATREILTRTTQAEAIPFYFDSHNNWQSTDRDTGFGLYTLRKVINTHGNARPLLEIASFFGIQRFRPSIIGDHKLLSFCLWPVPLSVSVASAAASGLIHFQGERRFAFKMLFRSEYMKAVLPAEPYLV